MLCDRLKLFLQSRYVTILVILVTFKVLLILLSVVMAYNIRNIVNRNQRFARVISWVSYNGAVFLVTAILIYSFISEVNIKYSLCAFAILIGGVITAFIISTPTLHYMRTDPDYTQGPEIGATEEFPEDIQIMRKRIESLQRDKDNLEMRLTKRLSNTLPMKERKYSTELMIEIESLPVEND